MRTICIPTNDRPELLAECVGSINRASHASDWIVFACPETSPKRGCRANTHEACRNAADSGASWILYLEDDVVISPDALLLCDAFIQRDAAQGILCFRRWHDTQTDEAAIVRPANHGLLGDGFLFPSSLWPFLSSWWFRDEPEMGGAMWDWSVSYGLDKAGIPQWRPMINRSRNIGITGTHTKSGADLNHFGPCYSGEPVKKFEFE
jgi:hypothetical protein